MKQMPEKRSVQLAWFGDLQLDLAIHLEEFIRRIEPAQDWDTDLLQKLRDYGDRLKAISDEMKGAIA